MAGPDLGDPRTLGLPPVPDYLTAATPFERGDEVMLRWPTRIGVPEGWSGSGGAAARTDRETFLATLEALGGEVVEIAFPAVWEEFTSSAFNATRLPERTEIFLEVLRRDVRLFGVALSPWINGLLLSGDELLKGQRARVALLHLVLDQVFSKCDVLLQSSAGPMDMVGLPLIAFPIGLRERSGVPVPHGALVAGAPFGEERLLSIASGFQAVTDWHRGRPPRLSDEDQATRILSPHRSRGRLGVAAVAELAE
jgi:aspartyl-tRNA(Asn)/glutamyl-tRNA(Gln) amidotransferase subunit A